MRIVKLLIVVLLLFGCTKSADIDITKEIETTIERVNSTKAYENHNHKKELLTYYLPKNVGLKRSNQISTVMLVDNYEVFMALNVSEVMNDKLEKIDLKDTDFIETKTFNTENNIGDTIKNSLIIEQLSDKQYLVYLKADEMFFLASVPKAAISNVLEKMLVVSRTVEINKNQVVAQFSNKEEMNFEKEVIELFSESVPEEGFLRDIYESDKEDD